MQKPTEGVLVWVKRRESERKEGRNEHNKENKENRKSGDYKQMKERRRTGKRRGRKEWNGRSGGGREGEARYDRT